MAPTSPLPPTTVTSKSSAVKAGWICLVLGYLTFWIFGFGFVFFSVTFILSVVAMCTNQVRQGVVLLVSTIASMVICILIFVVFVVGAVGAAAQKASEDSKVRQQIRQLQQLPKSDPAPKPVTFPVATTVTPSSLPPTVQTPRFANATDAQKEAVRRYPDIGVAGTKLNIEFVARFKRYQKERPDFLLDPSWPLRLAEEIAPPGTVPATQPAIP